MPARPTEVRHAATSDHRIVRFRERPEHLADTPAETDDGALPLRPFSAFGEPADSQSRRDMAIAVMAVLDAHPELIATPHVELARDILESASRLKPDDLDAIEALAQARWQLGQTEGALEALERVLQQRPAREFSVVMAAEVLGSAGDSRQAVEAWQAAIGINPWMARYWYSLALGFARLNSWSQCRQVAQQAAARFPTSVGAKYLLVESNLQLGNQQEAEECFHALEEFAPGELSELRAWFARHPLNRNK
jgi:tetratricopeptide (TPR) repeat protein